MKRTQSALRTDINITPLIDIVLVLLIVFIVMVPALAHAHRSQGTGQGAQEAIRELPRISLLGQGRFLWGDEAVLGDVLVGRLVAVLGARPKDDRKVVLRVPPDLPLRTASEAMDLVHLSASRVGQARDVRIILVEAK